jgi:hypothetical protein
LGNSSNQDAWWQEQQQRSSTRHVFRFPRLDSSSIGLDNDDCTKRRQVSDFDDDNVWLARLS